MSPTIDKLRDKLAIVLQKTYTNMDLGTASRYFGMSEMELVPGMWVLGEGYQMEIGLLRWIF